MRIEDVISLAEHFPEWRTPFNTEVLYGYFAWSCGPQLKAANRLAPLAQQVRRPIPLTNLEGVFGRFCAHHSFRAPVLNWRIKLTEPVVTRTLANLLNAGFGDVRAKRIQAFLMALKTPDLPDIKELENCVIQAEKNRIDLEIWIPLRSGRYRPVIIEAKFGHKLTVGQLANYLRERNNDCRLDMTNKHCVILGLCPTATKGLRGPQVNIWEFVAWRDLWLRFEKERPPEDDPNLTIFLHMLWHRIGFLNPEVRYAR